MPTPQIPAVGRAENPMAPGAGNADSAPANPLEKYYTLKDSYARDGKPWDWRVMRDIILADYEARGWNPAHWTMKALADVQDSDVAESPERARLIRLDDAAAKKEADALRDADIRAAQQARVNALGQNAVPEVDALRAELAEMRSANEALMARMEKLMSGSVVAAESAPAPPAAEEAEAAESAIRALSGEPSPAWTRRDLLAYADRNSITVPDRLRGATASKAEILETVLAGMQPSPSETEPED